MLFDDSPIPQEDQQFRAYACKNQKQSTMSANFSKYDVRTDTPGHTGQNQKKGESAEKVEAAQNTERS